MRLRDAAVGPHSVTIEDVATVIMRSDNEQSLGVKLINSVRVSNHWPHAIGPDRELAQFTSESLLEASLIHSLAARETRRLVATRSPDDRVAVERPWVPKVLLTMAVGQPHLHRYLHHRTGRQCGVLVR